MSDDVEKEEKEEKAEEKTEVKAEVVEEKAEEKTNNGKGFAIASMVLGIISIPALCLVYPAIPCAILAIVFAVVAKKKSGKSGMTTAGLVLGIVSLALEACMLILITVGIVASTSLFGSDLFNRDSGFSDYQYDYYNSYDSYDSYDNFNF
ncbi:MAG: DUF4190 domain-containing protein [Firmicutes bacterium]|nr:DUF4190 domain-containing protein [Bacillota bacterium]